MPVFFPRIVKETVDIIANASMRRHVRITDSNQFLFAYTSNSMDGTTGYNEIRDMYQSGHSHFNQHTNTTSGKHQVLGHGGGGG